MWRRPACQTLSKTLDISSATAPVAPDLAILSDTTVRRSVVDREDLEQYWNSKKGTHFSRWSAILLFTKTLLTTERRLTGRQFLAEDFYPTFLNTGITDETSQQSVKQDSFRHILKSSANMYESSGSQFFRTTTGMQWGPDVFDESRLVMTFVTILGVMEILYTSGPLNKGGIADLPLLRTLLAIRQVSQTLLF